jgi:hypothetical protein
MPYFAWLTNDNDMAAKLRAIDQAYDRAKAKAARGRLALKVQGYRDAKAAREASIAALMKEQTK